MARKLLLGGIIFVLLLAIPFTVFLLQKQQETRSRAAPSTTLSLALSNPSQTVAVGQEFGVDININPGSNWVSYVKIILNYDKDKLSTAGAGLEPNTTAFPVVLESTTYGQNSVSFALSIGADPTKAIQTASKIGKITFKALASTGGSTQQLVTFGDQTQVLSTNTSTDAFNENVISTKNALVMGITTGPTPTPGPTTAQQLPVCTGLNLDRTNSGSAPFSVAFAVNGTDPDGTISRVVVDFGDGPSQTITQGGEIGTKTVSVPVSHTYNNAGTFTAKATVIDNTNNTSAISADCTKVITVTQLATTPTPSSSSSGQTVVVLTPTPQATATPIAPTAVVIKPNPSVPPSGPGDTIVKVGGIGVALSVIGALLFIAL